LTSTSSRNGNSIKKAIRDWMIQEAFDLKVVARSAEGLEHKR
jgi:hypothetical protein